MKLQRKLTLLLLAGLLCVLPSLAACEATALADMQSKTLDSELTLTSGRTLRLANLAGRVDLVAGSGDQVTVEATIHAAGKTAEETQRLLAAMAWVETTDSKGRSEMALSYPVEDYRTFVYPDPSRRSMEIWGWTSSTKYLGRKVKIVGRPTGNAPVLYADLKITLPADADFAIRQPAGSVRAGALTGDLEIDTGSGDVTLDSFDGDLLIDTGSGDVTIGRTRGESHVDTGSGDVEIDEWIGNGVVDTGSGDVVLGRIAAGSLVIDTGSGDVVVRSGTASELKIDTGSGDVAIHDVAPVLMVVDTGSGNVDFEGRFAEAERFVFDTGSGDVEISGELGAAFQLRADQGSGDLSILYENAELIRSGRRVVGARRGTDGVSIEVDTGSGDCVLRPSTF